MFFIIELMFILLLVWLIANVLRYWFFRDQIGGGPFALSDRWIEMDEQIKESQGEEKTSATKKK